MTKVNSWRAVPRMPFTFGLKRAGNDLLTLPSAQAEQKQKHMRKTKPLKIAEGEGGSFSMIFALRFRFIATSEFIQFTQDKKYMKCEEVAELQQQSSQLNKNKVEARGKK